ncbi:MAG: hypothetical protein JWO86_1401 [Myxococcaceae bacterium]|jgi:hypothetical protein|nr:hypothetical protein [Myxococcaceae bacterium]
MSRSPFLLVLAFTVLGTATAGCRGNSDAARRQAAQATAEAEEKAQEASLTSTVLQLKDEAREAGEESQRARGEVIAAFRLEQSDYRSRLQRSLDLLDGEVAHARRGMAQRESRVRDLRSRRDLLKDDLVAVDRSTEQDWATLRTKVERDLESGRPGPQLPPRTDHVPGEAP